eukprot:752482-Hanusia_phi.AAC.6
MRLMTMSDSLTHYQVDFKHIQDHQTPCLGDGLRITGVERNWHDHTKIPHNPEIHHHNQTMPRSILAVNSMGNDTLVQSDERSRDQAQVNFKLSLPSLA